MIQFYQKRDFGSLISDTFTFFKENGKNYFKNYFLLNGILLIIIVVLYVVGYRSIFAQIFSSNINGGSYYYEQYFQQNWMMLIGFGLIYLVLLLACMLVIYSYPVLYLKRLSETKNPNITTNDMIDDIKKNTGKFFIYLLGLVFIMLPIAFLLIAFSSVLMLILIGFLLLIFVIPFLVNVVNFILYDYYNTDRGFFGSLSYAFRSQFSYGNGNMKSPFWKYWGSTATVGLIVQIASGVFAMIPMVIMYGSLLTVPDAGKPDQMGHFFESTMGILYSIFSGISIIISSLLINVIYVNTGLLYYDSRIDLHRNEDITEIDTIGNGEA